MNTIKTIKALIRAEVTQDQPSFPLLKGLLDNLQVAIAREKRLSVDALDDGDENEGYVRGNGVIYTANNAGALPGPRRRVGHRQDREEAQDQVLAALDNMTTRLGVDPMASLFQAIPHLAALYPDEALREQVHARIRQEIDRRLGGTP